MIKVSPSILAADFLNLGAEIDKMEAAGADYLHFDVMDGMFVPNISFGQAILRTASKHSKLMCDVHLMINEPERYIEEFAEAGARVITVHAEASKHLNRTLNNIRKLNCLAGVALNPATSPDCLRYSIGDFDVALMMTVNPGFGGQRLIPAVIQKIAEVKKMLGDAGVSAEIEVDGDVNMATAGRIVGAGATMLVAGTAFFQAEDPKRFVRALKTLG